MIYDVIIAGCGVVGAMTARELTRYKLRVCVLEKGNDVSEGASRANSGIIHAGYDPEPGTLKAEMNVSGVPLLYEAARELSVPFKNNGSLVCAFNDTQDKTVRELFERGKANGVPKLKVLSGDEARALEPALSTEVTSALYAGTAGVISPYELTVAAAGNAIDNGAELKRDFEITRIEREGGVFTVRSADGDQVRGKYLINAAGGFSDKIAEMAGDGFFRIIPRSGEYLLFDKAVGGTVSRTLFPVPTEKGKGCLVIPTVHGNLLAGPTATPVPTPESRDTTSEGLALVRASSALLVPSLDFSKVITSFTGVRSSEKSGDFIIKASEKVKGLVHLAAIDSPGLSSCAAIAKRACSLLSEQGLKLSPNESFDPVRAPQSAFALMSDREKDAYIKKNPDYGRIVCRCEGVSEGEIREAVRREPRALSVDAVKRRTRAGMGRCQGGFCSPFVMKIISEETGIPLDKVTKSGKNSYLICGGRLGKEENV